MGEQDKGFPPTERQKLVDSLTPRELADALLRRVNEDPDGETGRLVRRLGEASNNALMRKSGGSPAEFPLITFLGEPETIQKEADLSSPPEVSGGEFTVLPSTNDTAFPAVTAPVQISEADIGPEAPLEDLTNAFLGRINEDPDGTYELIKAIRRANYHATYIRDGIDDPEEHTPIHSFEEYRAWRAARSEPLDETVPKPDTLAVKLADALIQKYNQLDQLPKSSATILAAIVTAHDHALSRKHGGPDMAPEEKEQLVTLEEVKKWKAVHDLSQGKYDYWTAKRGLLDKEPTTLAISSAQPEVVADPESTASYWAEKLRASGEYDIAMSSFHTDWLIGGKRLGDLYPKTGGGGWHFITDNSGLSKLDSSTTFPAATKIADAYLSSTKYTNNQKHAAVLVATPKLICAEGAWNEPLSGNQYDGFSGQREWYEDAIRLFGFPDDKRTKFLNHEQAQIIEQHRKAGRPKGKTREDYPIDTLKTYLLYHHPLNNTDHYGRQGNMIDLAFGLTDEDSDIFLDRVKADPSLLGKLFNELYPGLLNPHQVSRRKVKELIIATPASSWGNHDYMPLSDGNLPFGYGFIATKEKPRAVYEKFDRVKLDPPLGES